MIKLLKRLKTYNTLCARCEATGVQFLDTLRTKRGFFFGIKKFCSYFGVCPKSLTQFHAE